MASDRCECGRPIGPTKKELKATRKELRKIALADIVRIHSNVLEHRPWYLPRFLWGRIVAIVLNPDRGQARG